MSDDDSLKHLHQPVGKLKNMAPEVYDASGSPYDGRAADVWSLGIAMFMLLFGFPPMDLPSPHMDKRCAKILNGKSREEVRTLLPTECVRLVTLRGVGYSNGS